MLTRDKMCSASINLAKGKVFQEDRCDLRLMPSHPLQNIYSHQKDIPTSLNPALEIKTANFLIGKGYSQLTDETFVTAYCVGVVWPHCTLYINMYI